MRELSTAVDHPEFLKDLSRVDVVAHPAVRTLYDGDGTLGWEGDSRLCLYLAETEGRYYLYRLEHDEVYRLVCRSQPYELLNEGGISRLIRHLLDIDTRRGFNAYEATMAVNTGIEATRQQLFDDTLNEETIPRIVHWAGRAFIPGIDIRPHVR